MKYTRQDDIRRRMAHQANIRTMSVVAHVDHGKTTLTDCLLSRCGIIPDAQAGERRRTDTEELEIQRGVTIKSTAVTMCFDQTKKDTVADVKIEEGAQGSSGVPHLIHLIDCPGHVDFSSEVSAALRISDGALVVVDCIEGVCVQTETVLRQAIDEGVKPILFLNKLDRAFLELDMDLEKAYLTFRNAIEQVNRVVSIYSPDSVDFEVAPQLSNVAFGSGLHNWAFTLDTFADIYAKKTGVPKEKWMRKLWGDNFYDKPRKVWTKKQKTNDGRILPRGFCEFILKPIQTICRAVMNEDEKKLKKLKKFFALSYKPKDLISVREKRGRVKDVLKFILKNWLQCGETLLNMVCDHLPSPIEAQRYRVQRLYEGSMDDEAAVAIAQCDPNGPLMFYVSKMVPSANGRFYCLGRVFSGTLRPGMVRILGPEYVPGGKKDLTVQRLQRSVIMMVDQVIPSDETPCGNVVGLVGVDQYIHKNATLTTSESANIIKSMQFSVNPVVSQCVETRRAQDLPKLVDALKRLVNSDPLVQCTLSKAGEHIISGAGELHLECVLHDLEHVYMKDVQIVVSQPIVSYCESVSYESKERCLAKSKNKLNRIWMRAGPLHADLSKMIEDGDVSQNQDRVERTKILTSDFEWHPTDARKIWSFGNPGDAQCNVLVDQTHSAQYLNDVQDSIVGGFKFKTEMGVLCEEPLRGVRFDLDDVKLHSDPPHRNSGQIVPATSRVIAACQLSCGPQILEPIYEVNITVPMNATAGVYTTLSKRRGEVVEIQERIGTPLCVMKAHLPVDESFGFDAQLRGLTRGQAFPQMSFSHWQAVSGDVYEEGSRAHEVVMSIRKRKGLPLRLPKLEDYNDRL